MPERYFRDPPFWSEHAYRIPYPSHVLLPADLGDPRDARDPDKSPTYPNCKTELTVEEVGEKRLEKQLDVSCKDCNRTGFIAIQSRGGSVNP